MQQHAVRGHMFNHYHIGSYLLWRLWPEDLPFMNQRQSARMELINEYLFALSRESVWRRLERDYAVDHVVADRQAAVDSLMDFVERDTSWALVFADDQAALYLKRGPRFAPLIARFAYPHLRLAGDHVAQDGARAEADTAFRHQLQAELERAAAASAQNASLRSLLANLALLDGRWGAARRQLEQARAVDRELPHYYERLGLLSLVQGEPRQALRWFERQRRETPRQEDVEARLGQAYLALGDTARARAQFARELRRFPQNRIARALMPPPGAR
jgi:Flp pilus assembly protein TadD